MTENVRSHQSQAQARESYGTADEPYLVVDNLTVQFPTADGLVQAVSDLSYSLAQGRTLGIVGESGSGKSVSSMAIMGLHDYKRTRMSGSIRVGGREIIGLSSDKMRSIRGGDVAMIFQDPLTSLHPFYSIGKQLVEAIQVHQDINKSDGLKQARDMLERVGIPHPDRRLKDYPHNLSGGMRQRVMIAMALLNSPELLIADEPTTALDVTVQAQIIDLLQDLQKEFGTAIILITHDLGVVADMADDVVVMYGGRVVERGGIEDIYYRPEMPYTWGLLGSVPRMDAGHSTRLRPIPGQPPSLIRLPKGCVFRPRCAYHELVPGDRCDTERPDLLPVTPDHAVRCHLEHAQRREIAIERLQENNPAAAAPPADAAAAAPVAPASAAASPAPAGAPPVDPSPGAPSSAAGSTQEDK